MPQGLLNFSWCECSVPRWHLYEGGVYLKSNLFLANYSVVTNHFNLSKKKQPTWCSACQKGHLFYCSQFLNFQVNITAIHRVNKDLMSDLLLNIRTGTFKRICLVHSKFMTAIQALIGMCSFILLFYYCYITFNNFPHHNQRWKLYGADHLFDMQRKCLEIGYSF